ncbi:Plant self-incompatibility protein S1 [Sesbania bispinosa]|nr:Plant self-incompatibility protein S1 [Sesbania bispinosa]
MILSWVFIAKKKHDLGFHVVPVGGFYRFHFSTNPLLMLYVCGFNWTTAATTHHFDIYDGKRDDCGTCVWDIQETGPCQVSEKTEMLSVERQATKAV